MVPIPAPDVAASRATSQTLRRPRQQPLRVPGVRRGAYLLQTDPDGSRWLLVPRRSALDGQGCSELLREPEPSWCLAGASVLMARNAGATGVRVEDRSTGMVYELAFDELRHLAVPHQSAGYERQLRVPLPLWRVRPSERHAAPPSEGVQLSLFAVAAEGRL